MSIKKKVHSLSVIFASFIFLSLFSIPAFAVTTTTTLIGLGSETVDTVNLVTDGIKGFLINFSGPYFFIVIIAMVSLIILGMFRMMKDMLGG